MVWVILSPIKAILRFFSSLPNYAIKIRNFIVFLFNVTAYFFLMLIYRPDDVSPARFIQLSCCALGILMFVVLVEVFKRLRRTVGGAR